jgi:acetyltransferase-like isoleucine patch superfamily enzyme
MIVRGKKVRTLLAAAAIFLPKKLRRLIHRRLLGYDIHPSAQVGRSLIDVDRLVMSEGASIGSLTVIRGCEDVVMRKEAVIGSLVWVNSVRKDTGYFAGQDRHCALIMDRGSVISCLHLLDCCDTIEFGAYSGLGGFGSQVLTHTVDIVRTKQTAKPVRIGHHTMVCTSSVILPGVTIPACSVVAAGSVMTKSFDDGPHVYIGVPAVAGRKLNPESPFFTRTQSHIW